MNRIDALRKAGLALLVAGLAVPVIAQRPALAMLDQVDPGLWELRIRGGETQKLCLQSARRFIQLRHSDQNCERVIVEDGPGQVAVQYTCRGHGYGLTRIRRETARLLQVDSQGVEDGLPFEFAGEARRIGSCQA